MQVIILKEIAAENPLLLLTACDPSLSSRLCANIQVLLKMTRAGTTLLKATSWSARVNAVGNWVSSVLYSATYSFFHKHISHGGVITNEI